MHKTERDEAIAASSNVSDARERFRQRMKQVVLSRAYRRPKGGDTA